MSEAQSPALIRQSSVNEPSSVSRIINFLKRVRWRFFPPQRTIAKNATVSGSRLGSGVVIGQGSWIYNSSLGDYSYCAERCSIATATVGKFCSIGPGAYIGLPRHPVREFISTHPAFHLRIPERHLDFIKRDCFNTFLPVEVGSDVWIGAGALIMGGIKIADGAVVGAGAVV